MPSRMLQSSVDPVIVCDIPGRRQPALVILHSPVISQASVHSSLFQPSAPIPDQLTVCLKLQTPLSSNTYWPSTVLQLRSQMDSLLHPLAAPHSSYRTYLLLFKLTYLRTTICTHRYCLSRSFAMQDVQPLSLAQMLASRTTNNPF